MFRLLTGLIVVVVGCSAADAKDANANVVFLEQKKKEDGVVSLPSGLLYKIMKSGTNPLAKSPNATNACECHYAGTLIDGTEFDSSYSRGQPSSFAPNQVIRWCGWDPYKCTA